jgi:hypothetical protein
MSSCGNEASHSTDSGVEHAQTLGSNATSESGITDAFQLNRIHDLQIKREQLARADLDKTTWERSIEPDSERAEAPEPGFRECNTHGEDSSSTQPLTDTRIMDQGDHKEFKPRPNTSAEREEEYSTVDPDPFGTSKLFQPSGKPFALELEPQGADACNSEDQAGVADPDPFGASKFFGCKGDALGFDDRPVMVQDNLPPANTYRRRSSKTRRQCLPAENRLLEFISNNDNAEMFDSEEFRRLLASAHNEQAENGGPSNRTRPDWESAEDDLSIIHEEDMDSRQGSSIASGSPYADKSVDSSRSTTIRELSSQKSQAAKAVLDLTESQLSRGQARFHIFEKVQMIALYRFQHQLAKDLENFFNEHKTNGNSHLISDLHPEAFEDPEWTYIERNVRNYRKSPISSFAPAYADHL